MALVKCPKCGTQAQLSAKKCPACGASLVTAGKVAAGCAIIIVGLVGLLVAIGFMIPDSVKQRVAEERKAKESARSTSPVAVEPAPRVAQPVEAPAPETPTPPAELGIGVTQAAVREKMERIGYVFEPGVNQVMGRLPGTHSSCQLLGDPRDLEFAGMLLPMSAETDLEMLRNIAAVSAFMGYAIPSWPDGDQWALKSLSDKKQHVESRHGAIVAAIDKQPSIGITTVGVRRAKTK